MALTLAMGSGFPPGRASHLTACVATQVLRGFPRAFLSLPPRGVTVSLDVGPDFRADLTPFVFGGRVGPLL